MPDEYFAKPGLKIPERQPQPGQLLWVKSAQIQVSSVALTVPI